MKNPKIEKNFWKSLQKIDTLLKKDQKLLKQREELDKILYWETSEKNIPVVSRKTQWVKFLPFLWGLLIFVWFSSVANGDSQSIGYMIAGISILLSYFGYKSAEKRKSQWVLQIKEFILITLLLLLNFSFIGSVGGNYLINNPISILPFIIFSFLYLKLCFLNTKNETK